MFAAGVATGVVSTVLLALTVWWFMGWEIARIEARDE